MEREKEKLPDLSDVEGAAFGLVRLHQMYKYDLGRFLRDGVISTTLENGQVVVSGPSVLNLTCESFMCGFLFLTYFFAIFVMWESSPEKRFFF